MKAISSLGVRSPCCAQLVDIIFKVKFKLSLHTRNGISFNLLTFELNNIAFDKSREIIGVQCKYLRAAEGMIEGNIQLESKRN